MGDKHSVKRDKEGGAVFFYGKENLNVLIVLNLIFQYTTLLEHRFIINMALHFRVPSHFQRRLKTWKRKV